MKKIAKIMAVGIALVALAVTGVQAVDIHPLTVQEAALKGATHLVVIKHTDLTTTTTNTAQTLGASFKVAAKQGVELVAMELRTAFVDDATNAFSTLLLTVGDGSDADLYLTSTELNSYGTEVFLKYGRENASAATTATFMTGTTAITATTNFVVSTTAAAGGTLSTNAITYVTGITDATSAAMTADTQSVYGKKLYTATDYVDFTFDPSGMDYGVAALDAGEVWLYFRVTDARKK